MVVKARVTAAFRRLVALLARAFYAGECPPKTAEEEAAAAKPSRTKQQVLEHDMLPFMPVLADTLGSEVVHS